MHTGGVAKALRLPLCRCVKRAVSLLSLESEMNNTLIPLVISIITLFLGLYFSENETQVAATAVIYSVWVATAYIVSVVENKND